MRNCTEREAPKSVRREAHALLGGSDRPGRLRNSRLMLQRRWGSVTLAAWGVLDAKIVLVTGAGRGLGAAIAQRCVSSGATVIVGDIAFAERVAGAAHQVELDVTDQAAWSRVARHRASRPRPPRRTGEQRRNPQGVRATRHDGRGLPTDPGRQRRRRAARDPDLPRGCTRPSGGGAGSIINISSVRGLVGGHGLGAYSTSKFALRGLTKVAAIELGPIGVRVNAVCPGPVVTDMTMGDQLDHLDWDGYLAQIPVGRFGQPDDVAAAVCWLASDDSSFVTGTEIVIDGGLTAGGITAQPRRPGPSRDR